MKKKTTIVTWCMGKAHHRTATVFQIIHFFTQMVISSSALCIDWSRADECLKHHSLRSVFHTDNDTTSVKAGHVVSLGRMSWTDIRLRFTPFFLFLFFQSQLRLWCRKFPFWQTASQGLWARCAATSDGTADERAPTFARKQREAIRPRAPVDYDVNEPKRDCNLKHTITPRDFSVSTP